MAHQLITDQTLRRKYCPPLEESLFIALASDFDIGNEEQRRQLEALLDDLKEQAVVEQELELATPIPNAVSQLEGSIAKSQTSSSQRKTDSNDPDATLVSVTTGISDLPTSSRDTDTSNAEAQDEELLRGLENANAAEKEQWLRTLFPSIESIQISETFAKCNKDLQSSIDDLLNLSFIHEDIDQNYVPPPVLKGIDGFVGDGKTKKLKSKKSRRKHDNDDAYLSDYAASSGATTPSNVWQSAAADVEFIVSRTQLSTTTVKSIYHHNNANLALTIRSMITKEAAAQAGKIKTDELLQLQVEELKFELEDIADIYIFGALLLAQMMPSAAKDLLEATMRQPEVMTPGKLVAQYTPINLSEDEKPQRTVRMPATAIDPGLLAGKAGVHSISANQAFSQASAAYRRGRSDKLMGGAAAYYAEVGHEQRKRHKELIASAADALVGQQSSSNSLDLHGVSVEHAVRIARSSVEDWYETLGDRKYAVGGIGSGYRIIVGLGTHSAQGIGRIGPAVTRMLMREGWKVNVQRGEIFVEGKKR